jgi:hypothetical protein
VNPGRPHNFAYGLDSELDAMPIDIATIPGVPDLLLARCRSLASRLPDPCEGSRGHLAMERFRDFERDLNYIRTDPGHDLLKLAAGGYYNMRDLLEDMFNFAYENEEL